MQENEILVRMGGGWERGSREVGGVVVVLVTLALINGKVSGEIRAFMIVAAVVKKLNLSPRPVTSIAVGVGASDNVIWTKPEMKETPDRCQHLFEVCEAECRFWAMDNRFFCRMRFLKASQSMKRRSCNLSSFLWPYR